jgi:dUTPase
MFYKTEKSLYEIFLNKLPQFFTRMCALLFSLLDANEHSKNPVRATAGSVGLDLALPKGYTILPGQIGFLDHRISFRFPKNVYGQLHLRSSSTKLGLSLLGGVIGKLGD